MGDVKVEGLKTFYRTGPQGLKKGRKTFLFVHGAGGSSEQWTNQLRFIDSFANSVAVDLPGHGNSEGTGFSSVLEYAEWLSKFISSLGLKNLLLAGHSMGGAVVQEIALMSLPHLIGLILIGTGARLRVHPRILQEVRDKFTETIDWINRNLYSETTDKSLVESGLSQFQKNTPVTLLNDFIACDHFDRMANLGEIKKHTLIIVGENDVMTPVKYSQYIAKKISDSSLKIIPDAGHMVMVEKPKEVNEAIEIWYKKKFQGV